MGRGQVVRQRFLVPSIEGSNPSDPANALMLKRSSDRFCYYNGMKQLIIAFDMDGVLVDHTSTVLEYLASKGIIAEAHEAIFSNLPNILDEDALKNLFDQMYETPEGTLNSKLMPGAIEAVKAIRNEGCKVYLLSRRNDIAIPRTMLERLGLWPMYFDHTNTFFAERSFRKPEIAADLGITHYVDDQPSALVGLMKGVANKYLFDQYNCMPDDSSYVRIESWAEFTAQLLGSDNMH